MPEPRHEHGSGVTPVGEYAPGGRISGLQKGVAALPPEHMPVPPRPPRQRPPQPPGKGRRPRPRREDPNGPSQPH